MPARWTDAPTECLISYRRRRNIYFHNMPGRDRSEFWERAARRIQRRYHLRFTGQQVERRWRNLVRNFNDFCEWRNGARNGRWSRDGERYYRTFRNRFWDRPGTRHGHRRRRNTAHRRPLYH